MNKKLLSCLIAGALATTLALAAPAFARGGGGGHGGGFGGGHFGGGGMHFGGGGAHFSGGDWGGMGGGSRFAAPRPGGAPWGGMESSGGFWDSGFFHPFLKLSFPHPLPHPFRAFFFVCPPQFFRS